MSTNKYRILRRYHSLIKAIRKSQQYGLKKARSYEIVIGWLHDKLSHNQFLILSGVLVGCSAGLAGVLLKSLALEKDTN